MARIVSRRIRVYGVVQGVGFRPFVSRLAERCGVRGSVCNRGSYVEIAAESGERELAAFLRLLPQEAPPRSAILRVETEPREPAGVEGFRILPSSFDGESGEAYVPPDLATCDDCRRELFDPQNRRYLHPFINCTACGPRMTILDTMPYDRVRTSMGEFPMCPDCAREYRDPADRRFHAQPVCCPDCGPRLHLVGSYSGPAPTGDDGCMREVRRVLRQGGIAAVKGIGGFHLCCDATDDAAVARLRRLKNRPAKPFAVMARDMQTVRRECAVPDCAARLLNGPRKPIVLLGRLPGGRVSALAAPGNSRLGMLLPYAPVQMLLFDYPDGGAMPDCLIMTSGNVSGAPICIDDAQATEQLASMCDIILSNDRPIRLRADDSVAALYDGGLFMIRRSRGFAPLPFFVPGPSAKSVFAAGGELKNTFCLTKGDRCYLSPYVGDLSDARCVAALDDARRRMERLLGIRPGAVACDLHPGYNSAAYARSLGLPVIPVQHHFAHIAACMAENGLDGEVLGAAFDGTGYGTDGTVWGGEFLRASYDGFERLGCLKPFPLAGGDRAAREGWRPALGMLTKIYGDGAAEKARRLGLCGEAPLQAQLGMVAHGLNCVTATSAGRLFDAAAAILGVCRESTFEGQAASALETAAGSRPAETAWRPIIREKIPFAVGWENMIEYLVEHRLRGDAVEELAAWFHTAAAGLVVAGLERARETTGISTAVLSGGCFQNLRLLGECERQLRAAGFTVCRHAQVPPGDGGIALGQAAVAMRALARGRVSD